MLDVVRSTNRPELILRIFGEVLACPRLELAAAALVTELAERFKFDRVSLAVLHGSQLRIVARSHGIEICDGTETHAMLVAAMHEAMEQSVSLAVPVTGRSADWITLSHEILQRRAGGVVATIPLAADAAMLGAVLLERASPAVIEDAELIELEHLLSLVAPSLQLMRRNERTVWRWLWDGARARWHRTRTSESRWMRTCLTGLAVAVIALLAVPVNQRVTAPARVEGEIQRVLVAPVDSFLKAAFVRPGDAVQTGQVLAELVDQDLILERERWASQLAQHQTGYATAMSRADRAEAAVHLAQQAEASSQLELAERDISRASIVAPFDGIIIQGDLSQSAGAPIRQGDTLFTIAPAGRFRVIVEVDESDIAAVSVGQSGSLALSALPWDTLPVTVTRITPLATALEQRNVFEVEAQLRDAPAGLRPGLRGNARINVGRRPLAISWGAAIGARVRQFVWARLP